MMLAGAENGGSANIIVVIAGNAFVAAMEGLMVAIQGAASGILRNVQPFLQGERQGNSNHYLKKELKENH